MKAILVIDMPKSCADCKLADFGRCWGTYSYVHMRLDDIPVGCPLKPMPEKKQHGEEIDYEYICIDGWNACIEELEK